MDLITHTMALMDSRLTATEEKLSGVIHFLKDPKNFAIPQDNPASQSHPIPTGAASSRPTTAAVPQYQSQQSQQSYQQQQSVPIPAPKAWVTAVQSSNNNRDTQLPPQQPPTSAVNIHSINQLKPNNNDDDDDDDDDIDDIEDGYYDENADTSNINLNGDESPGGISEGMQDLMVQGTKLKVHNTPSLLPINNQQQQQQQYSTINTTESVPPSGFLSSRKYDPSLADTIANIVLSARRPEPNTNSMDDMDNLIRIPTTSAAGYESYVYEGSTKADDNEDIDADTLDRVDEDEEYDDDNDNYGRGGESTGAEEVYVDDYDENEDEDDDDDM